MPLKPHPTDPDKMVFVKSEYNLPKEWVGLTNDEAADFVLFHAVVDEECVRAIEAKLKEKNT